MNRLLHTWNDARAGQLFSENVAQDEPYPETRPAKIDVIVKRIGAFGEDKSGSPSSTRLPTAGGGCAAKTG